MEKGRQGWQKGSLGALGHQLQRSQQQLLAVPPPPPDGPSWSRFQHTPVRKERGEGHPKGGRSAQDKVWQPSTEGEQESPREAGRLTQQGGGEGTPLDAPQHGFVCNGGGQPPPRRKARTCRDLSVPGHFCRCRRSMETSITTTMGHTWQGYSQTMPYSKVVDAD